MTVSIVSSFFTELAAVFSNDKLRDANGVCVAPTVVQLAPGEPWTGVAADVVQKAGRRETPGALVAPAVSPPVNKTQEDQQQACVRFGARTCVQIMQRSQSAFSDTPPS